MVVAGHHPAPELLINDSSLLLAVGEVCGNPNMDYSVVAMVKAYEPVRDIVLIRLLMVGNGSVITTI